MTHDYRARVAANEAAWKERVLARQAADRLAKGEPEPTGPRRAVGGLFSDYADLPYVPIKDGDTWGPWRYNARVFTLTLPSWPWYEIDLEQMTTSAEMLDWIFQVSGKPWATVEVLGQLVKALDDLLHPQANLCSGGCNKKIKSVAAILKGHRAPAKVKP